MATISPAEYEARIKALEKLNATLGAEIDRMRQEYNQEIDEFNAGFDAGQQGLPESAEPLDTKYDVWKCGYAWGAFERFKAGISQQQTTSLTTPP